jgi:putative ABC transport system substrate-binding protein
VRRYAGDDNTAAIGGSIRSSHRRLLLGLALGALAVPRTWAQAPGMHRILWLSVVSKAAGASFLSDFIEGLAVLGYSEGRNLILDARWGENSRETLDRLAFEAAALKPAVIVTHGPAVHAARKISGNTPVVIGFSGDPIELGIAKSLGRPGGRFTGVILMAYDLVGKRVELLHEVAPKMKRLALLSRPDHVGDGKEVAATREAATRFGLDVTHYPANNVAEFTAALAAIASARADGLTVLPDGLFVQQREAIARFSIEKRIPAISGWASIAEGGVLMTYGPNSRDSYRRLTYFVDRILRGTAPSELPIEQPTRFEFVINLKTAKALGLTIPPTIMVRADRIIE